MAALPQFQFQSAGLPVEQAFEEWRTLMSAVFTIEKNPLVTNKPCGDLTCYMLDDIMASRMTFNAQRMARHKALIDGTPDHLTFQYYRSGGFVGEIADQPAHLQRGGVVVSNMRFGLDVRAMRSSTLGLSIPHSLLKGVVSGRPPPVLDRDRNRLLAARIVALHHDLSAMDESRAAPVATELAAFVRRLFDPSSATDVLDGAKLDMGVKALAERVIARDLASPHLSPVLIAEAVGVSRATLYRAFAPDSVMDHVRRLRLASVQAALSDSMERRSLSQIAADYGFGSLSLLGRSYRDRFGLSPRDTRAAARRRSPPPSMSDSAVYDRWWKTLGAHGRMGA